MTRSTEDFNRIDPKKGIKGNALIVAVILRLSH